VDYLVTGGAGFIGSNFVRMLLTNQLGPVNSVIVLDKLTYAGSLENLKQVFNDSRLTFIQGDICDEVLVNSCVEEEMVIVHFAAESHVDRSITGSRNFVLSNVLGTQTLLEAARLGGTTVFVQVSTDEVYGSIPSGSWTESEPLMPNSPYAASKAAADLFARAFFRTYGLDVRITRCSNNYGPNQFPEKLIPLFITNLMDGLRVPVYGQGANIRDWLHVDDHCRGIYLTLMKGKAGEIYNIGGGTSLSNLELTHKILNSMGLGEDRIEYVADRLGHDFRYSVNHKKISQELSYEPSIDFELGLERTIKWFKENEPWWRPLKHRSGA